MTKEEAIKGLKENLCSLCAYGSQNMDSCDIRKCDNRDFIKVLEQQPSQDCVSRQAVLDCLTATGLKKFDFILDAREKVNNLPPVTPTQCIATFRFSKEDLREICNERIEVECTHGTCKDCNWWDSENHTIGYCNACKHQHWSGSWSIGIYRKTKDDFYCADYEKRDDENGSN